MIFCDIFDHRHIVHDLIRWTLKLSWVIFRKWVMLTVEIDLFLILEVDQPEKLLKSMKHKVRDSRTGVKCLWRSVSVLRPWRVGPSLDPWLKYRYRGELLWWPFWHFHIWWQVLYWKISFQLFWSFIWQAKRMAFDHESLTISHRLWVILYVTYRVL